MSPVSPSSVDSQAGHEGTDVGMLSPVFGAAQQSFALLTRGPQPLELDGHLFTGLPPRWVDLGELRRLLPSCPQQTQDEVWSEVVVRVQAGSSAWMVGAVGLALPSLGKIACEVCADYAGDIEDVHSEIVTGFCRAVRELDPEAGRIFARLYWAARRAGMRWRYRESVHAARTVPVEPQPAEPPQPAGHPDLVLVEAVRDGAISEWEALLIGASRLEGVKIAHIAAECGMLRRQVHRVRVRAEERLVAYLADKKVEQS